MNEYQELLIRLRPLTDEDIRLACLHFAPNGGTFLDLLKSAKLIEDYVRTGLVPSAQASPQSSS